MPNFGCPNQWLGMRASHSSVQGKPMAQFALSIAAVYGLIGVAFGAFGAHALAARLTPEMQSIWHTAVAYQFYHALALFAMGLLLRGMPASSWLHAATWCFAAGVLIFAGSLYLLALTGIRWWGAITPLGGLLLIAGWATLLIGVLRT